MLLIDNYWGEEIEQLRRRSRERQAPPTMDQLLDKIAKKGIDNLSKQEQQLLDRYRNKMK